MSGKPWEAYQSQSTSEPAPWETYQAAPETVPQGRTWSASDIIKEPVKIGGEMLAGFLNLPVKAVKGYMGLYDLATGGDLQSATEAIGNRNAIQSPFPSKTFEALGENVVNPSIQYTAGLLRTEPSNIAAFVEAGGDVATLLGAGWGNGNPLSVAANRTGNAIKTGADATANKLMDMTLKQSTTLPDKVRRQNVATALEGNYMPNATGAAKLNTDIAALEQYLADGLRNGQTQGVRGSFQQAINNIDELRPQALVSGNPTKNIRLIDNEIARLQSNPNLPPHPVPFGIDPLSVPIEKLQQMKVTQGRELQNTYGEMKPAFQNTIDKARVRGFKEELEQALDVAFPELAETNSKLGSYYTLKKQLDRSITRIENRQGIGIDVPIKAGGGAVIGGGVGAAIGTAIGIIEHPAIAPLLARQLYKVNKGKIPFRQAMDMVEQRLLSVTGGLGADISQQ